MMGMSNIPDFAKSHPNGICRCEKITSIYSPEGFLEVWHEKTIWFWQINAWDQAGWTINWYESWGSPLDILRSIISKIRPTAVKLFTLPRWREQFSEGPEPIHVTLRNDGIKYLCSKFPLYPSFRSHENKFYTQTVFFRSKSQINFVLALNRAKVSFPNTNKIIVKRPNQPWRIVPNGTAFRLTYLQPSYLNRILTAITDDQGKCITGKSLLVMPVHNHRNTISGLPVSPNSFCGSNQKIKGSPFQHLNSPRIRNSFANTGKGESFLPSSFIKGAA